jgi:hypothetical protein
LPLQSAEAEHVDFDERVIHLVGHVKVVHEIGVLCCDEGTLLLPQEKVDEDHSSVDTILLSGHVDVVFSDGSHLVANEGIIDCQKQEGTFLADPPDKVTYTGLASGDHRKIPVRATGRALKANISKTESGYTLTSLRGEGAVNVEYYTPTESEAIAAAVIPSHTSEDSFDRTSMVNPEAADPQIPFSGEDAS